MDAPLSRRALPAERSPWPRFAELYGTVCPSSRLPSLILPTQETGLNVIGHGPIFASRARRTRASEAGSGKQSAACCPLAHATVRPPGLGSRSQRASTGRSREETRLPGLLRRSVVPRWPPLWARIAGPRMGNRKCGPVWTGPREGVGDFRLSLGSGVGRGSETRRRA